MRCVSCWNDMQRFGFNILTGEACHYGIRLLIDLNDPAIKVVEEYFSISRIGMVENWNSGSSKSIMLGYDDWKGLAIIVCLQTCKEVAITKNSVIGLEEGETLADFPSSIRAQVVRVIKGTNHPHEGSRNTHYMTGRTL